MKTKLTPLQHQLLNVFFKHSQSYYLTGGGALAGYYLGHRSTYDLDLFSNVDSVAVGDRRLREVCIELGATIEEIQTSPRFLRRLVTIGADAVVVDLVHDDVPGLEKATIQGIQIDTPEEILANKLCALLSRSEIRDLIDVVALLEANYSLAPALQLACAKDGGMSAAQLAWVLTNDSIDILDYPQNYALNTELELGRLRQVKNELIVKLTILAHKDSL